MKNLFFVLASFCLLGCADNAKKAPVLETDNSQVPEQQVKSDSQIAANYAVYGQTIEAEGALSEAEMREKFKNMQVGDTLEVKFASTATAVCKKEGCWMKVDLGIGEESMVKFNDHAFLVPKDIEGKEVVVEGIAFIKEVSVEELRHYAEDAGKSDSEIAAITQPKKTLAFEADGVLIEK